MTFANLSSGDSIFLDANTLVYHFQPHPLFGAVCNQLLARIEKQEVLGFTSTHILSEVAHRLMMLEAANLPGWKPTKVKQRLLQQPSVLQNLRLFKAGIEAILQSRIQMLSIAPALILQATGISQQHGLLSNDALIIAAMQANGLANLASHDADFDRVPGIARHGPA